MTNLMTGKRLAVLAVMSLSLSACSALGTSVAEDDPETVVPNTSMGRAIMEGLGAVPAREAPINYTPRAPLVVPKEKLALVPPEDPNKLEASGIWPEDNDVKEQRILRQAAAAEAARGDKGFSPSELMAVRISPEETQRSIQRFNAAADSPNSKVVLPRLNATTLYDETGKPQRKALVEPPVAYLEPAPGVPVTTEDGAPTGKKPWWKLW